MQCRPNCDTSPCCSWSINWPGEIGDPGKAIVVAGRRVFLIHPAGQPFAAVHPHLNGKREPRLDPGSHEPEVGIIPVVIQVQALAWKQPSSVGLAIPMKL
jgi:hypothetical protein